jgi:undecaprenyl-diphosphatase
MTTHLTEPPAWLQAIARDVTALGSEVVLGGLSLGTIGLLIVLGAGPSLRFMLMSTIGGTAIAGMLKIAFSRPRPDLLPHGDYVFTPSFPSGHATMTAVVFLSLAFIAAAQSGFVARLYIVGAAVVAMIAVGLSRIMLGVHWPSDVLGGWLLGIAWVIFCARLLLRSGAEDGPSY